MIYDDAVDLYEAQYQSYRDDIHFYTNLALDYNGPVLELGTGTARLSLAIAQRDVEVVALELSEAMLSRARLKINAAERSHLVTLLQGDMRDFALAQRFPLIIAAFNSLMHLYTIEDQDACLTRVAEHLDHGGIFAFDLYNPRFDQLNVLKREPLWQTVGGEHADLFLLQEDDPDRQIITTHYYYDVTTAEGLLSRQRSQLKQRYFYPFEITRALQQAGFQTIQLYGNFDKQPHSAQAPHLIGLARKASPSDA